MVRAMSVDRNKKGRFKANSIKSQFDNITHQISKYRDEVQDSDGEDDDIKIEVYRSYIRN